MSDYRNWQGNMNKYVSQWVKIVYHSLSTGVIWYLKEDTNLVGEFKIIMIMFY